MIEKIRGIRIKGRCFKKDTDFLFYKNPNDRISVVFGKNGSGKSTISEGIASITKDSKPFDLMTSFIDANQQVVLPDNETNVFVFNEKYIDENVKIDDDGLGAIVLLGSQVNLQKEIDEQEVRVTTCLTEADRLEVEYSNYQDKKNPLSPDYHRERIFAKLKENGGWAEIDSQIKGNKIKSQVSDLIVDEIGQKNVKESLVELQAEFNKKKDFYKKVSDSSISFPDTVDTVKIDPDMENIIINLLAKKIDEPVLSDREKLILKAVQEGAQDRIEFARNVFSQEETAICPYCYQVVTEQHKHSLIESINKVLNKDVDEHKDQLLSITISALMLDTAYFESIDKDLSCSVAQQLELCNSLILKYNELIDQKAGSIYTPICIESKGLLQEIGKLNSILEALEVKRLEFNNAAEKRGQLSKKLIEINKRIAHVQIAQMYKDYIKQNHDKTMALNKLEEQQKTVASERDRLRTLQQRQANIGLAIDRINHTLEYVFLADGRLSIELHDEKYYLKSNGKNVLPKHVSIGERNILALCYFFTQILSNQKIGKLYQNEALIVIDDPISSFDFENKVGISSLLRYQTNEIIKGNFNSKILFLSHDLDTVLALKKAAKEICDSIKGIASIPNTSACFFELKNFEISNLIDKHNEYGSLLKRIYHFANEDSLVESLTIGNEMRRVLEAFSSFLYRKGIEKVSYDQGVLKLLGEHSAFFENLMYRLVLHGESHYEEQVYSLHDGYGFYQFVSENEKIKTAKSILCFMFLLNPLHIRAYLQEEAGAIDNIKLWIRNIPDNSSFNTKEEKSRTIPLYTLPLSAGLGNGSFEDVPYVDYHTNNKVCNFALKVSGDSMEPNITDGSTVLIKRQETIDDQVVGAFFYNGKVYCKYIKHENGIVYLHSYNQKYPPIRISEDDNLLVYGKVVEVIAPE